MTTCPDGICSDPDFSFCDVTGAVTGTPGQSVHVECTPGELEKCDGATAITCSTSGDSFESLECGAGCDATSGCLPFCNADEVIGCEGSELTKCNGEGTATVTEVCAIGCASSEPRCLTFEPTNGLAAAFNASANEPAIVLPAGARIDTDVGLVQDANGNTIAFTSVDVDQVGGLRIRAFIARSLSAADVTVTGTRPIAFVARGPITVSGRVKVRATGTTGGPGSRSSAVCDGGLSEEFVGICSTPHRIGTGGGGNDQVGGKGGASNSLGRGGGALTGFSPLAGGCRGGDQMSINQTSVLQRGGAGGGAIQFVSATRVSFSSLGLIDVGGGGGLSTTGGGSGGNVVIEAPEVSFSGPMAGVVANGGSGGGCQMSGSDATVTTAPPVAPTCANYFGGNGGTVNSAPTNGCQSGCDSSNCPVVYGGGGGSVGRIRIATIDGSFTASGSPIMSTRVTTATLTAH